MLNEIKRVFRQSLEALRAELGTREPEDQVAELLSAMRRELVAAKAALPEYERAVAGAKMELARERDALEKCERRASLAERIGDEETARIARDFAEKHREKATILEQKLTAVEAELVLRRREADEMRDKYKEADANRFALLAQLRAAGAAERRRATFSRDEGAFADFARMAERVEYDAAYVDALEEIDDRPPPDSGQRSGASVDEKLEELKRKMRRE